MHRPPSFGCWEKDVTMRFDDLEQRYIELPEEEAIARLSLLVRVRHKPYYEAPAHHIELDAWSVRHDKQLQLDLMEIFAYYIDLPMNSPTVGAQ